MKSEGSSYPEIKFREACKQETKEIQQIKEVRVDQMSLLGPLPWEEDEDSLQVGEQVNWKFSDQKGWLSHSF